jgi:hypothetical protein
MKRGLPQPTLVCPDNEQENEKKREDDDHLGCGIGTAQKLCRIVRHLGSTMIRV